MNSRQRRKAEYNETHSFLNKSHWAKTSEFGVIPRHTDGNIKSLLTELHVYGLNSKHSGSKKLSKIKDTLKRYRSVWANYKHTIDAINASMADSEKPEEAEPISEPIDVSHETN